MKQLVIIMLLLCSCTPPIHGGRITGKTTTIYRGVVKDDVSYFLEIERDGRTAIVRVSEQAWNQATKGMEWPFEVK